MPSKMQLYRQIADEAARELTENRENWTRFLATSARLYKYPYHEQLMIYAQRPDATACADYAVWTERMNRYIRRGAHGIALIDETSQKLRYVFDVADTGTTKRSKELNLWQFRHEYAESVATALTARFESENFEQIASKLAAEYWDEYSRDVLDIVDSSLLSEYNESTISAQFR